MLLKGGGRKRNITVFKAGDAGISNGEKLEARNLREWGMGFFYLE